MRVHQRFSCIAFFCLALVVVSNAKSIKLTQEDDIVIELDQGLLRGMQLTSRGGRDYLAFLGIPYAKPPVGELRFQPPVKAEPWEGTLNATNLTPQCTQKDKYNPLPVSKGSEDCLHLNIYTPRPLEELETSNLPVMFYLHGGGATGNASRYRGDYFMDEDVIFITLHFRLGVLGHLSTHDSKARGNQAVRDQIMALQWVQDNVKHFGGDPNRVTVFGNSFGGFYTTTHLLSPMSKGLFHKAIAQSGTTMTSSIMASVEDPRATAFELGKLLNCPTTEGTSEELLTCLRAADASELVLLGYDMPFVITVDPPSADGSDDIVLPDKPLTLLRNGQTHDVPLIVGVNSGEALGVSLSLLLSPEMTEDINENWSQVVSAYLSLAATSTQPEAIANAIRDTYLGDKAVSRDTEGNLTAIFSDRLYTHPCQVFTSLQRKTNDPENDVFLYYFDREVPLKYSAAIEELYQPDHFLGASHADELQLLFPYDNYPYIPVDSEYFNISRTLVKLWSSFATTGKPSGMPNEWLPITSESNSRQWYHIDDEPRMTDLLDQRMNFWNSYDLDELYTVIDNKICSPIDFQKTDFL